ncbi:hypothetical protein MRX96_059800 [Rhipicephalus microplus]
MAEDCSPQREPSGQPERSESSLTEPEVTNKETTEDQDAVEQRERGHHYGCDLSKDSAALTPRTDATLPSEKASAMPRASVAQGWWSKGQSICNVSIGVLVACARQKAQEGTRPGSQRGEPAASPHGRNHRDVATWTSQDGGDPPVSYVSSRPWRRQERARVGVAPAHLYRPFQGRTVEDADRRANGACLPVPAGTRFCECGAVVIHNSHELGKLHRHRTQATQPSSRESSQERSGAAVRAMLARAAQEADFAQWLLRVASGHASSESPPAPLSITATVERGRRGRERHWWRLH